MLAGDKLVSANGDDLIVEDHNIVLTEEPVLVYNFQVEDFHTYFVGNCEVWVHNAECLPWEKYLDSFDKETGDRTYKRKIDGEDVRIKYTKGDDGKYYPRFEDYAHPEYKGPIKANFKMTGDQAHDTYHMNKQVFGSGSTKMDGYTWHHL